MSVLDDLPIEEVDLSVRAWKYCKMEKVNKVGDLLYLSDDEIFRISKGSYIVFREIKNRVPEFIHEYNEMVCKQNRMKKRNT